MRRARVVFFLVTLLVMSTLPLGAASEGRSTNCDTTDMGSMPDPIMIGDQECEKIALGILAPGTIVEFDVTGDVNFDFLIFRNAALQVYANNQSYRSPTYWAEETVFEDMVGSARWHWTVPTDEGAKNWYVVLDNLDHPGDDDQGAQGGSMLQVNLDISFPSQSYWTIHDGLVNLGVNSHTKLVDENSLILDEGTQISISAIPMAGDPDLFLLTENQRLSYLDGNPPEFRITGADLLQITSEDSVVWTVDSTYANQPLYLYADNEDGPTGGGDGSTEASFTVIVTLMPILDATITSDAATTLDVGETVTVSANSTPNLSNQVDTSSYEWDLDDDGTFELTQSWAEISWAAEGTFNVNLRINGVDSRTDTSSISIDVDDATVPTPIINGGNNIVRGFEESFTVTSSSLDNFGIDREEWYADELLVQSDSGTGNSFTYSFSSVGNHSVDLRVYDSANLTASLSIVVVIQDRTSPELDLITGPKDVMAGEENTWRLNATDPNSPGLTWSWDFDRSVDIDQDGDTTNDAQATGDLVTWTFTKGGDYSITCTVTNEQGLSSTRELNVHVEAQPSTKSSAMTMVFAGGAILLSLAVIAGGIFLFRAMGQRRAHQELIDLEDARQSAEEAAAAHQPERDEQLAMFQNRGGGASSGFQRSGGGDEMAQIAGVGSGYGAQQEPVTVQPRASVDDDLLSAFEEPVATPVAEPEPEPKPDPKPAGVPAERASVLSGGIQLPDVLNQPSQQTPPATAPEPQSAPVTIAAAPVAPQTTEVVGSCGECGQHYAVDMPLDIEQAQIDCPKCGNRSTIRR
ncbi:MAG: PKD domain-containing protein [Candidatus Poseidoniales archaeon]|nr:PKD domain-containing protein [Candidatus Poseidoniales archaeon]